LSSRGRITEIASDGLRVTALVPTSSLDCDHVVGWTAGTRSIFRAERPWRCELNQTWFNLRLVGTTVRWQDYWCGNECYVAERWADFRVPYRQHSGTENVVEGYRPVRPPPPRETHRGVALAVANGAITLRRAADGRARTIRPPGGAVDAELEDDGLFYAYNAGKAKMPGRLVFVPFGELFAS
jgi:hypothetical protein